MNVRVFGRMCVVFTVFLCPATGLSADPKGPETTESWKITPADASKSRIYTHPVRGFTIAVPPGVKIFERDEKNPQISIRSRKGYTVSIQSGPVRSEVSLADMPLRLEAKYLGKGKPWSRKTKQTYKQVAGLPAIEAYYEGPGTRARLDIIRGQRTDHVFIFFAAEREYFNLEHEYDWMLTNFRPGPDDIIKPEVTMASSSAIFAEPGYGYSMRYPKEWVYSKPSGMTTMFSGAEGDAAYSAIISVQNIAPPKAKSSEAAAVLALSNLKSALQKSVQKLVLLEDKPWEYVRDTYHLNGREVVLSYHHAGQSFMKRIVVIPRPFQKLAHIWSYTAPVGLFKTYGETADRMLKSWTILASSDG